MLGKKQDAYNEYLHYLRIVSPGYGMKEITLVLGELLETQSDLLSSVDGNAVLDAARKLFNSYGWPCTLDDPKMARTLLEMLAKAGEVNWQILYGAIQTHVGHEVSATQLVVDLMRSRLRLRDKKVLIAEGETFAPFLTDIVNDAPEAAITITTNNDINKMMIERVCREFDNVSVVVANIYAYEFSYEKYDFIFALPIFGSRQLVDNAGFFTCKETEMVATENLLLHLRTDGILAILLPARITFAGGQVKALREFIQNMYRIDEINALPEGVLDRTSIKTFVFIFSDRTPDDISVNRYKALKGSRFIKSLNDIEKTDETFVMLSEVEEQGDWNVDKFFASQDDDWNRYMNVNKASLGSIAQVFRGKNVSKKDSTGNIGVVNISNILDYTIDYDNLTFVDETDRKIKSFLLQDGDVLIPARGTAIRVATFREQEYPCIASSNLIVIRPKSHLLDSTYLKMFFDSRLGRKIIESAQQGTGIMNISYKDLQSVEIPVPDMSKQRKLADTYNQELEAYINTITEAETRWNKALADLQDQL